MPLNAIIAGDTGTGKTYGLRTLLPVYLDEHGYEHRGAGQEVFLQSVESGPDATLAGHLCGASKLSTPIHWNNTPPIPPELATLKAFLELGNSVTIADLDKRTDPNRFRYRQLFKFLAQWEDFNCTGCGNYFGNVSEWGTDSAIAKRTLAVDSLSGLQKLIQQDYIGGKIAMSLPERMWIQGSVEQVLTMFFTGFPCNSVLTAHIERETDPLTAMSVITIDAFGQKMAPKLRKLPDEVILADHDRLGYFWCTSREGTTLKSRRAPDQARIEPSFRPLFEMDAKWQSTPVNSDEPSSSPSANC